jgi:hypothetical protein
MQQTAPGYSIETEAEADARYAVLVDQAAIQTSAILLAGEIASDLGMTHRDALDGLCKVSNNLLHLLASPEGWVALSEIVASISGLEPVRRLPTRH